MYTVYKLEGPPAIVTIANGITHFKPCPRYLVCMPVPTNQHQLINVTHIKSQRYTSWLILQIFNHKGTLIGMSVSVLEADFQCKHNIGNNNVFTEWGLSLFCPSASTVSVTRCIVTPLLARTTEVTPIDWSVSQLSRVLPWLIYY